jgi:hypothetical protein
MRAVRDDPYMLEPRSSIIVDLLNDMPPEHDRHLSDHYSTALTELDQKLAALRTHLLVLHAKVGLARRTGVTLESADRRLSDYSTGRGLDLTDAAAHVLAGEMVADEVGQDSPPE